MGFRMRAVYVGISAFCGDVRRNFRFVAAASAVCASGGALSSFGGSAGGWYAGLSKFPLSAPEYVFLIVNTIMLATAGISFGLAMARCERRYVSYRGRGIMLLCAAVIFGWIWYPLTFTAMALFCGFCCAIICCLMFLYSVMYFSKINLYIAFPCAICFIWTLYLSYVSLGLVVTNIK